MKNALVIGGNSGIGLALVNKLIKEGCQKIYIVGKDEPDLSAIDPNLKNEFEKKTEFAKLNFVSEDLSILDSIDDIDTLIITTGFGRVALLEDLTEPEVKNLLKVNLDAVIRILKHYYDKIHSSDDFNCAVMVSICGRIVSPFFSVYGAAKAGLRFFIENVNCELEANGYQNRILEVSPGSLKGTNFNGKGNQLELVEPVVEEIYTRMMHKETLFIPSYEEVYKGVIERYEADPKAFGLQSYQYKVESGRVSSKPQVTVGYLSGTFDLFHIGHLNLLRRAKQQCDYLIVGVHDSGAWKGKETFIPFEERCAILEAIKYVDKVVAAPVEDSDAWDLYHYHKLFVGSDYQGTERFNRYEKMFEGIVDIVYFPYTQSTSSSQIRDKINKKAK